MKLKPNIKSDFDEFLKEEDMLVDAETTAVKRIIAYQIKQEMEAQKITKTKMAKMMNTSRAVVDRLLNPQNHSMTLQTLESATSALGKRLDIAIV
ncbi:XRE family transcriptional regulator [Sulfurimonas hydrogeniphila]|uniref:XRE family transcriptional regulator n=1 Tax=Sulfurimonas hydrogeniphila TaxID=2509341 RepID=UPI00125FEF1E|nr:XRE family transcriptional regulator [Sulfurimonas hydrogeniphila]